MKPRLQTKFAKTFILPLLCGILVSIIFTVTILLISASNLENSETVKKLLREADEDKSEPIIANVGNILYKKIQTPINVLLAIKEHYKFLVKSNVLILDDEKRIKEFIQKYSINIVHMANNYNESISQVSKNNNSSFFEYSNWLFNKEITKIDKLNSIQLKHLYLHTNLNLIYRSHFEMNLERNKEFCLMYSVFESSQLFTSYPIQDQESYYKYFTDIVNPAWCRNDRLENPNYYYYKCRHWYQDFQFISDTCGLQIFVSTPYLSVGNNLVTTAVCLRFEDPLIINSSIILCIDIMLNETLQALDQLNNLLSGYFFIQRIESEVPIYYPNILTVGYKGSPSQYQFNIRNPYYINDINDFEQKIYNFNHFDNKSDTDNRPNQSHNFHENNVNNSYTIYPIKFNLDEDPSKTTTLLNLIYINTPEVSQSIINNITYSLYVRLFMQLSVYLVMGSILILISRYLITSIAKSIVKPIRMIKSTLEDMNNKNLAQLNDFYTELDDEATSPDNLFNNLINDNEETKNLNLEEDIADDKDEFIDRRSEDIDELFATLIKLKNVLSYTRDISLAVNKENILNYLFAKKTFIEVNNLQVKFLCDSNIGNLALKCKKYDKAIFHLIKSINVPEFEYKTVAQYVVSKPISNMSKKTTIKVNDAYDYKKSKFKSFAISNYKRKAMISGTVTDSGTDLISKKSKFYSRSNNINSRLPLTTTEEYQYQQHDNDKKKILESRLPKLLYSYKKYYKNIKKLRKMDFDSLLANDVFSMTEIHSLERYERTLLEYLKLAEYFKDNQKIAEALLELIEFSINFKLRKSSTYTDDVNLRFKKNKEEEISNITEQFKQLDNIMKIIMSNIEVNEYLKKIIEIIQVSNKAAYSIVETPIFVLVQRSNYLKGKFCYYCENLSLGLKYFQESSKVNLIANAVIIKDSLKKTKKIMKLTIQILSDQIEEIPILIKKEKQPETINKLIATALENEKVIKNATKFIEKLDQEVNEYTVIPKDICVLINFNISDPKQIDKSMGVAENIFDNFVTSDDRFTLFSYRSHANPIINLSYKNLSTVEFIRDEIVNFSDLDNVYKADKQNINGADHNENGDSCASASASGSGSDSDSHNMFKAIDSVFNYLFKKKGVLNREIWIIVVTHRISDSESKYLMESNIKNEFLGGSDFCFLNFIKTDKFINSDMKLIEKFSREEYGFFETDKLENLKLKMRVKGYIQDEIVFMQEKYDYN